MDVDTSGNIEGDSFNFMDEGNDEDAEEASEEDNFEHRFGFDNDYEYVAPNFSDGEESSRRTAKVHGIVFYQSRTI